MTKPSKDALFLQKMQEGVEAILADTTAELSVRIAAITAGTKIMMVKHKIKDDGSSDGGHFFSKRRGS
jgi:hypothetical protein